MTMRFRIDHIRGVSVQRFVDPSAMASAPLAAAEVQALSQQFMSAMSIRNEMGAVEIATHLLLRGNHENALEAFSTIGNQFPSQRALAAMNAGAACFGLGRYEEAIGWYELARNYGAPAPMIADNVAEAKQALAATAPAAPTPQWNVQWRPTADLITSIVGPRATRKVLVAGGIPDGTMRSLRTFVPPQQAILAALDLTVFGSGKDAIVFTEEWILIKSFDERLQLRLSDVAGRAEVAGLLRDKVSFQSASGTRVQLPCGEHAELMELLLNSIGANNQVAPPAANQGRPPGPPAGGAAPAQTAAPSRLQQAKALMQSANLNDAVQLLLAECSENPHNLEAARTLGTCLAQGKSYEAAANVYASIINRHGEAALPMDELVPRLADALQGWALTIELQGFPSDQIWRFSEGVTFYAALPYADVPLMTAIEAGLHSCSPISSLF